MELTTRNNFFRPIPVLRFGVGWMRCLISQEITTRTWKQTMFSDETKKDLTLGAPRRVSLVDALFADRTQRVVCVP